MLGYPCAAIVAIIRPLMEHRITHLLLIVALLHGSAALAQMGSGAADDAGRNGRGRT